MLSSGVNRVRAPPKSRMERWRTRAPKCTGAFFTQSPRWSHLVVPWRHWCPPLSGSGAPRDSIPSTTEGALNPTAFARSIPRENSHGNIPGNIPRKCHGKVPGKIPSSTSRFLELFLLLVCASFLSAFFPGSCRLIPSLMEGNPRGPVWLWGYPVG